jgi:hypothetical protein
LKVALKVALPDSLPAASSKVPFTFPAWTIVTVHFLNAA